MFFAFFRFCFLLSFVFLFFQFSILSFSNSKHLYGLFLIIAFFAISDLFLFTPFEFVIMAFSEAYKTFKAAFPHTIPVMAGYLCLGGAFGILLQTAGYDFLWAGIMSITIFAGAMQFIAVNLLTSAFSLLNAFIITIMVNARHIFYGFSMLEKFENTGWAKPYLIFSMTDETFSLLYSVTPPEGIGKNGFYFCIAFLNHTYWIAGGIIGALVGAQVPLDFTGVEFIMTALFVAIFTEQCRSKQNRIPAAIGLGGSLACLLLFGPDQFILPAMVLLVAALSLVRKPIEKTLNSESDEKEEGTDENRTDEKTVEVRANE